MSQARKPKAQPVQSFDHSVAQRLDLTLTNRQRTRSVDQRLLRRIIRALLADLLILRQAELSVCLVAAAEMTRANETFLHHAGSTDVITFDYSEPAAGNPQPPSDLHGEILVCVDEAVAQARRFRTTWQAEVVRYVVHGVLHLLGHDDHDASQRRAMKREENRLVLELKAHFALEKLGR